MKKTSIRWTPCGLLAADPKAWGFDLLERDEPVDDKGFREEGDAAIVEIDGPLLHRPQGFFALFCDSYEAIGARVKAALASNQARVVMRINSPGGDAAGCLELARELRAAALAAGKPLIAFVDGQASSAAYAIACAASPIVVPETGRVGSIGAIQMMLDMTEQDRMLGVKVVAVMSGERKGDGNPHLPLTESARDEVQLQIDQMADLFFGLVAELRPGLSVEGLRALQARTLLGERARGEGLADAVAPWSSVLSGTQENAMPGEKKDYEASAKESLRAIVDDEKASAEDRESARKALKALEAEPEKKPEEKAEGGEGEPDGDEKKAEVPPEKKPEEKAAAQASAAADLDLARRVHELEARESQRLEAAERSQLLSRRPDFSDQVRAKLQSAPLNYVRMAVEDWPVVLGAGRPLTTSAAALSAPATRGESQGTGSPSGASTEEAAYIAAKMGASPEGKGVVHNGRSLELGFMTPDQARARLIELQKGAR